MAGALRVHVRQMCQYSEWANQELLRCINTIQPFPSACLWPNGHFAGSIQGLVAHMLAAELVWFHRLTGRASADAQLDFGGRTITYGELTKMWGSPYPGKETLAALRKLIGHAARQGQAGHGSPLVHRVVGPRSRCRQLFRKAHKSERAVGTLFRCLERPGVAQLV